jgi:hypothetical protein
MITDIAGSTEITHLTVPLTMVDRQLAQVMAAEQTDPVVKLKVYANTLAVQALQAYCRWLAIPTDLGRSHSQNDPQADVADLYLMGINQRVECCPVQPNATHCQIPPIARKNRLGYMAIAINEAGCEATMIGFLPAAKCQQLLPQVPDGYISLQQFEALDNFLDALEPQRTSLTEWLQGQFTAHWQALPRFTAPTPEFRYLPITNTLDSSITTHELERIASALQTVAPNDEETRWQLVERLWSLQPDHPAAGVRRGVDLGLYLDGAAIALVISILPKPDGDLAILLRVYPTQERYLPSGLQLTGLYESGEAFLDVASRAQDNYVQLKFSANPGERFGVRVQLGDVEYVEHFMV